MERVLLTEDGKRVVINTKTDPVLYSSPCNPPNTGTNYTRGTDLHYHKSRKGNEYFYFLHWSLWEKEQNVLELISRSDAEEFLIRKASLIGHGSIDSGDHEKLKEFGFNLLELEDA